MESGPRVSIGVEEAEDGGRLRVWNSRALVRLVWSTEGSVTGRNSLRCPQKGAALTECPEEGKGMGNREPTSQHSYDFDILQTSAGLFTNSWS